jgi:hypothetical protein
MKRRDFLRTAGIGSASMLSLPALTGVLAEPAWARSELDGPPAETFSPRFRAYLNVQVTAGGSLE